MILNKEQLQKRAREQALTHELGSASNGGHRFWPSFRSDIDSLRLFAELLGRGRAECTQPAEDWLLDHIDFIEKQAQVVKSELPRETLNRLPRLQESGQPRIEAICNDYLEQVDGIYDVTSFETYLMAYQDVTVLKLAETWALPSAMRVMIIHRLADAMVEVRHRHEVCESVANLLGRLGAEPLSEMDVRALLEHETRNRTLTAPEIVHLVRHIQEWKPDIQVVHDWLAVHLENGEKSLSQMVSYEHQLQAQLQVTCGNLVQSLHRLERLPWRVTFEHISHIDHLLAKDKTGVYTQLDFASRDQLRQRVAYVADKLRVPETLVAATVVRLAGERQEDAREQAGSARVTFLAYYLLEPEGMEMLRSALATSARPRRLPHLRLRERAFSVYITSTVLLCIALVILAGVWAGYGLVARPISWVAIVIALLIPTSEWSVALVHALIMKCCRPKGLLRYDFSEEVPEDARTMVVMPVLWTSVDEVKEVVERLLVHYFGNRQDHLHFAILADFEDASTATAETDKQILDFAVEQIEQLNARHGHDKFFLFHRERRLNEPEKTYMGWERKRGKLVEFVELLSGSTKTTFTTVCGETRILSDIRYVCTVDLDTQLPIGVAARLVATIHLPYNRPRMNQAGTRVIEGYGVLQPRIGVSYQSTQQSRFAALWAGAPGIDPYAFAVSDPYQDLFGQGIFVGKGIFDVAAFRSTLVNRIPDNQILSHDLLEGGFLRAGLAADIEVVDDFPATYYAAQRRTHRWIRGDWQLIKWLGRRVCDRLGQSERVDLDGLTRWQMIDNLRRSLLHPVLFVVALLGICALPGRVVVWEGAVLLTLILPLIRALASAFKQGNWSVIGVGLLQSIVQILTLPFQAVLAADAIARTLYRVFVSKRRLLEWTPSAHVERTKSGVRTFVYQTAGYVAMLLYLVLGMLFAHPGGRIVTIVGTILWLLAWPAIRALNQPVRAETHAWVKQSETELTELARETWQFYHHYVTDQDSHLPPDNVQYHPTETIAHRTSPTNIGLYLACVLAARDFAFIDSEEMLLRLEQTIATVETLDKWHGHLYNWYDTTKAAPLAPRYISTVDSGNFVAYLMVVAQGLRDLAASETTLGEAFVALAHRIERLVEATDFYVLYDADARLFSLGYHVDDRRKETVLYDLLASEARQASFVAIALGQVPVSHWFALGRTMTRTGGHKTLLSWSGTMFEYLMPWLVMRTYKNAIWESTYRGVVHRQAMYARDRGVPLGISESGYYAFDYQMNYQYQAFGVPGLGFDRGMERDLVIAPYATILSLPYAGEAGLKALDDLVELGARGKYGFYEAVDFTGARLPKGLRHQVIQSFMAHHQGMSMLTLANLLLPTSAVDRFHQDPRVQATDLLLQERVPIKATLLKNPSGFEVKLPDMDGHRDDAERVYREPTPVPEVNVLSNGAMTSVTTNTGSGFLRWKGLAVTRWREDPVLDNWGPALYIHDVTEDKTWSATEFPCARTTDAMSVFQLDKTTYEGRVGDMTGKLDVVVSPEVDAEIRRVRLVNQGDEEKTIEVTSFLELALATPSADDSHPAFSKLFVETSHDEASECLVAKRRSREEDEKETWAVHTVYVDKDETGAYEFETDRAAFIGRGYGLAAPQAMVTRLAGSVGSVADPAFVMRRRLRLAPGESASVYVVTGVADDLDDAKEIIHRLREPRQADRAFHLAWVRSQIDLRHLHLTARQAAAAHLLAARLLYTPPLSKERREAIARNELGQSSLWSRGMSGDLPIGMVRIANLADLPFVVLLARQHQYLCALGLELDLVVLDETKGGYQDELPNRLRAALAARGISEANHLYVLKRHTLSQAEQTLMFAVSRVILQANGPSLRAQLQVDGQAPSRRSGVEQTPAPVQEHLAPVHTHQGEGGEFDNEWGSFVEDGKAYQIRVVHGHDLPRPWSNILANQVFGCLMTELGTGYSWWRNGSECKLTPWSNDPVLDPPGECLYLRDMETDALWSATPKPAGGTAPYTVTHGHGYSRFESAHVGIEHQLEVVVPLADPIKLMRLKLRNTTDKPRRLQATYYAEWILGVKRAPQAPFIITKWDEDTNTLFAHNTYQEVFREATAFLHMFADGQDDKASRRMSYTGDRRDFLGRGGSLSSPAALFDDALSGRDGTAFNACGAIQTEIELPPDEEVTLFVLLGCTNSQDDAQELVAKYQHEAAYAQTVTAVTAYWDDLLGRVVVETPDRKMDVLMNGWLLYQALACRMWGRTAFYQAGGAFGYRDQLQDSLAMLHADSTITRRQILRNAQHQYQAGDVQHWWHEETGKGIRTRFSDDLLWLPYAVSRYIEHTGDQRVLDETVPFLVSDPLHEGELERYEETRVADETGTILEHCLRAIERGLQLGEHGLPLMGIGDWNDGMSRVGAKGRGESVWLGWFIVDILKRFCQMEDERIPVDWRQKHEAILRELEQNLNQHAWDGAWFRRAFTDSGTWLGSIEDKECRIDAIAQSWSVISDGAPAERQARAMRSFDRELVDARLRLARLLTPAFDKTSPSPGYIQGYPPGIRENGGQYTHGVIWSICAWAKLGRRDKAWALFTLLNPITHTETAREVLQFGCEPYVMSADIYTADPHRGRAGWSWYTGAAGWMYQAGLEYVLGVRRRGDRLYVQPCVPEHWNSFRVAYRLGKATYHIQVDCHSGETEPARWTLDGQVLHTDYLPLTDDGQTHEVVVYAARAELGTVG
ncbi:GH36-type glycosyl hydrolase domain-containing protein [Alicyclobacillus fodiniaquatilis]|uniref:GH36-type glycosyl hydrolase domain-containing protein n=1 Tax=Alicyclobacillus fodiniaquatilis TaxID=1661150 RepID=A0ABW4JMT8_9BACL